MKVGDKVKLTRDVLYPDYDEYGYPTTHMLNVGDKGTIAGMLQAGEEIMVLFQPDDDGERVFAVQFSAVKKTK